MLEGTSVLSGKDKWFLGGAGVGGVENNLLFLCIKHNYKVQKQIHSIPTVLKCPGGENLEKAP